MIVDLSMLVNEHTVVYPGDALPKFESAGTLEKDGFVDHVIHINNHLGTHVDAPGHMLDGKRLVDYPIERFVVSAVCVDARGHSKLGVDLLDDVEINAGEGILFYTGSADNCTEQSYATDHPEISLELAQKLVELGVSMVGVDMISFDVDAPFPIHKEFLSNDVLLIENLYNLGAVVGKRFKMHALPVNPELEAAPARVIAEVA